MSHLFADLNMRKPVRPYRTIEEFKVKHYWPNGAFKKQYEKDPTVWPCVRCGGGGWYYDPNDPPCPIEGNKCRDTLTCECCKGDGCGPKAPVVVGYKQSVEGWKAKLKEWRELREAYLSIQLTEIQFKALTRFGLPYNFGSKMFKDRMERAQKNER